MQLWNMLLRGKCCFLHPAENACGIETYKVKHQILANWSRFTLNIDSAITKQIFGKQPNNAKGKSRLNSLNVVFNLDFFKQPK